MSRFPLFVFCAASLLGWFIPGSSSAEKMMVLLSRSMPPYQAASDGLRSATSDELKVVNLEGDMAKGEALLSGLKPEDADLVVTIGTEATQVAQKFLHEIPLVYTMVLKRPSSPNTINGGVLIQLDPALQVQTLTKLFPMARKIGLIYNPVYSSGLIAQYRQFMTDAGLTAVTASIMTPGEIQSVLAKWTKADIDLHWSILDPTVMQPAGVKQLIEHAMKEKVPFVGLSEAHVQMGAFGALAVDYQDVGIQTMQVARKLLQGKKTLEPEAPRSLVFYLNKNVQQAIGGAALPKLPNLKIISN